MNATPERRMKLTLEYDGAGFYGWQVQPGVRTVQAEVEQALTRLTARPSSTIAAGRTDRGVHATGQVVSTTVPGQWLADELKRALNAVLPQDVRVRRVEEVHGEFHARYTATARAYLYRVGTTEASLSPFRRRWHWALAEPVDGVLLDVMAPRVLGEHSFRAFAKAGQEERGDRCTVTRSEWRRWRDLGFEYVIQANRFLHHMVRYLVGTMVDAARGRRPPADLDALLRGDAGLETSPPAPAEGLFLTRVAYPGDPDDPEMLDADLP